MEKCGRCIVHWIINIRLNCNHNTAISINFSLLSEEIALHTTQDYACTGLLDACYCIVDDDKKRLEYDNCCTKVIGLEEIAS